MLLTTGAAHAGDWTFYRHDLAGTQDAGEPLTTTQARALEIRRYVMLGSVNLSNPIVQGGSLYYTGGDGYIHALSLGSYSERWRKKVSVQGPFHCISGSSMPPIGAPAVVDNTVFVPGADGVVYALDAATGASQWATKIADVNNLGEFLWTSIFPLNGKIYLGVSSLHDCLLVPGRLVQLDQATGNVTGTWWADTLHRPGGGIWTQPAYDPATNRIFVTTGTIGDGLTTADEPWADAFVAIDPDTMQTVDWLSPIPHDTYSADVDFGAGPTLYDSPDGRHFVAATDKNGFVYAADRDDLQAGVLWSYQISGSGASPDLGESSIVSAPYSDGMLYVAGARTADGRFPGAIAGLDAFTGAQQWLFHPEGFVLGAMTVTGDVLFAGTTDPVTGRGKLYALDRATGEVLYQLAAASMFGEPTWANGALYVGDGTGGMYELVPNPAGPQPDFDLELPGLTGNLVAGSSGTFAATVVPKNGFASTVTLSPTQLPGGVTASFNPSTVGPASSGGLAPWTSTLTLSASPAGPMYDLAIVSGSGGGRTRSAGMWTVVEDFTLSATAAGAVQGSNGTSTVTISGRNGFTGSVSLSVTGLPTGTTASFAPNPASFAAGAGSAASTLTFATSAATAPGTYPVQVTGTSGAITRHATVSLTVTQPADFKLEIRNASQQVNAGSQVVYEVAVAATPGFSGPFNFTVTGLPPGATASFAPGSSPGVEELTISLAPDTLGGPWSFSIVAAGGGLTRTASALLTVLGGKEFDLTAPASVSVLRNGSATVDVQVSPRNGFTAPVTVDVQDLPSSVTATVSTSGNASTITLHASASAAAGTYGASIVASGGGLTRTSALSIEVASPSPSGCASGGATGFAPALLALLFAGRLRRRSRRAAVC